MFQCSVAAEAALRQLVQLLLGGAEGIVHRELGIAIQTADLGFQRANHVGIEEDGTVGETLAMAHRLHRGVVHFHSRERIRPRLQADVGKTGIPGRASAA